MRNMLKNFRLQTMLLSIGALLAAPAFAQSSVLETMVKLHSQPDEYYFFEADRKQVVDYKSERIVRICTGESKHLVPLKVTYDGQTATIDSGDCLRVEAKKVFLEPSKRLEPSWVIQADVDTMAS